MKKIPPRWVIKLGTGILTDAAGRLDLQQIRQLVAQIAYLRKHGCEVIVVSSGAVGGGMGLLRLKKRPTAIQELQACAAIGQPKLMSIYENFLDRHDLHAAQLLLTYWDLDSRALYQNIQKTLHHLLRLKTVVPIINENDAVSFEELQGVRFGDNDRLSAHVAVLAQATRLIILSNVPGLLPDRNRGTKPIAVVNKIDAAIEALAGGTESQTSVGGMVTKLQAAKLANAAGIPLQIASGREPRILVKIFQGKTVGTVFNAARSTASSRGH
jgi:glutamate 5-kinase